MTHRFYLYELLILSSITMCNMFLTIQAAHNQRGSLYPGIKPSPTSQEARDIEAAKKASLENLSTAQQYQSYTNPKHPEDAQLIQQTQLATPPTPLPPSYEAAIAGEHPVSSAQPYPTSPANPTPPAGAAQQAAASRQPAASAAAAAPRSYSHQVLQAAWAKTQSWGTYFSERAQAGWATIKGWFGWR